MSLKAELAKKLLNDMIRVARGSDPAVVLVVDRHTSRILSSALRMYDIMEAGVLVLQNLMVEREKLPDLPAIYFIEPTMEAIERLVRDFPQGGVCGTAAQHASKSTPRNQYLHAHLYFTTHVPQACMNLIKEHPALLNKLKSFVELNVNFLAFESRVFLFDQADSIQRLYFPTDHTRLSVALATIAKPLVSLCVTMQEYPHVRYAATGKSALCRGLATFFDQEMKKTIAQLESWKVNQNRPRGTLLIIDRSIDPLAPLMHEFTFQAMVNDLLTVKGEIAYLPVGKTNANGLPKTAKELEEDEAASELVLSEDDPLWVSFRHKHIGLVMQEVTAKFKEFKGANKMAALQGDDKSTVKDMIQAMKDMPEYKNMMKKYHKQMTLAQECMAKFDANKLAAIGELEQDMATTLTNNNDSIDTKNIKDRLVQLCQDPAVTVLDKLRLLMIFCIAQGALQDATRRELTKTIDPDLHPCIRNLEVLGVDMSVTKRPKLNKERLTELKQRNKEIPLQLMRYLPLMNNVLEQLVRGSLSEDSYPYTAPPPPSEAVASAAMASSSARKGQSARKKANGGSDWKSGGDASASSSTHAAASSSGEEDNRSRFIVFVLGGVTLSEMRTAYEVADKHRVNLYIGSTSTLTPTDFIRDISGLDERTFEQAIKHSQQAARGGAASSGAGRRGYADDSDDDEPINMNRLNIRMDRF